MHDLAGVLAVVGFFGTIMTAILGLGPIGRAFGDRVRGKALGGSLAGLQEQLDEVLARLEEVQRQLSEVAERQEFTERLVAQGTAKGALGAGAE